MSKKILIFSLAYYPKHVGGAEVAIKEITDRMSEDTEFHMVTLRFDSLLEKEECIGNVHVHRIGFGSSYISKILFVPIAALAARRLHAKESFDGMWAMMTYMLFPVVLARFFGVTIPYILTLQDGDPFEHVFERKRIRMFSPLLRYGFRNASSIQTISTYLANWAKAMHAECPVVVIPNGVATECFGKTLSETKVGELRSQYGFSVDDVVLISTSRLVHKNAYDTVFHALKSMPAHVKMLVVGQGNEEENLKQLVEELGIETRVIFAGHVPYTDIPPLLSMSDIFIRPSRSEGMGNSFIEAMAAGLPVITTQVGGLSDFIFDAKRDPDKPATAWAVDVDSPEQIVRAVREILEQPDEISRVCKNAKEFIRGTYEWDIVARRMRDEFFSHIPL